MSKLGLKILLLALQVNIVVADAQTIRNTIGARSNSLAYASSCIEDEWSLFNNIGGLAKVKNVSAAFTYDFNPAFKPFSRTAAVFCVPLSFGVAGIGAFKFGDDLYSEQILSAGFSNTFGIASLGIKGNYVQYFAEGFGSKRLMTISFGGVANLTPHLAVGAHIANINPPKISEHDQVPTIVSAGVAFKPSKNIFIATEIEKDLEAGLLWKSGFEYFINKKIAVRTGYMVNPQTAFFGFGMKPKKMSLDYCVQYNNQLGLSYQATAAYYFKSS